MAFTSNTGFQVSENLTSGTYYDFVNRFVTEDELFDLYPNIVTQTPMGGISLFPGFWGWCDGSSGSLGNGATVNYSSPIQIGSLTNWKWLSRNAAVKTDNTLWTWGAASYNGTGTISNYSSPVQIGTGKGWNKIGRAHV